MNMTREPETQLAQTKGAIIPSDVRELLTMLTYMRPAGSQTELDFVERFVIPLGTTADHYGNEYVRIGTAPILWSCHTDTVHKQSGKQRIEYGAGIATTANGSCLGADCGTGVWLMAEMIRAGVEGLYVFHADEEIGGLGSAAIAATPDLLEGIKFAIAFDRKGYDEIITHQMGGRCASDAFARSLAMCLRPLRYSASDGGTFTDTANYADIVPECCNLSVGYHHQHQSRESQDVGFALQLRDCLITADFSTLVCERDPLTSDDDNWDDWYGHGANDPWPDARDVDRRFTADSPVRLADSNNELAVCVSHNAEAVAEFITTLGFTQGDLESFIINERSDF